MGVSKRKSKGSGLNSQNGGGKLYDPMSVSWAENYDRLISGLWQYVPKSLGKVLVTLATFIVGISINGDWVNLYVHICRQFGYLPIPQDGSHVKFDWTLESLKLQNVGSFLVSSMVVSYTIYFVIGGFLHWYYYVRQRDRADEWKIQPNKWMTPDLERHEIILGSLTLFLNSSLTAVVACFVSNGGYSTVYYRLDEYGWLWFVLQWPAIFIYQDYSTYWFHRIYHMPFLYKNFHKLHHKYKQPTAFSVTAIHPVEALSLQCVLLVPVFLLPCHWFSFYTIAIYTYYHGIIDHSGINFKAYWWQPWQPDAIFHDNHHQYFHVNFAFNIGYWDKLHGTYRRKDRVYTENIFYGKGKALDEVSSKELRADLAERNSENPLAYRGNKMEYELSATEVKSIKKNRGQPSKK